MRKVLLGGAHGRAASLAERGLWPGGAPSREGPMAERVPSSGGAYGRVAYVAGWRACPSGLSSRGARMADWVHKLDEWCAQLCRSYAFPGIQQVCAEHSTSFCALLLGMRLRHEPARCRGGTGSRPAAGAASQAAHNRQGTLYRLGSLGGAIAINRRSIVNANVYGAECKTIEPMNRARYRRASPSAVRP